MRVKQQKSISSTNSVSITSEQISARIAVVDVFCGVGGLTHGFVKENIRVVAGLDSDESCKYTYEQNNGNAKFISGDISNIKARDISGLYPENSFKVLVGCAPCQPFSPYTKKQENKKDWQLLDTFADLITKVNPDIVSMENVPELKTFHEGSVYRKFFERLKVFFNGNVTDYTVHCPDYGVPQKRDRLVFFASKFGKINLTEKTHVPSEYKTVQDTIRDLPAIEAGQAHTDDPLHAASGLSDLNMRRIRQSIPGGTWRDWDENLRADCHTRSSGKTYTSVYGRMKWDEPSPTITTQSYGYGSGRFGHPEQNRAISLREAALLQTFPSNYQFVAPNQKCYTKIVGRHIGNAVPVDLGRVIAKSIKQHIGNYSDGS